MIITIASSDKITLSMFSDFYKSIYDCDVRIVDLNCLYSLDILALKLEDILKIKNRTVLIKYKMKTQTKEIPSILTEKSDVLIKFDIFSTEPEVIKSSGSDTISMVERWKKNIEIFNQKKI